MVKINLVPYTGKQDLFSNSPYSEKQGLSTDGEIDYFSPILRFEIDVLQEKVFLPVDKQYEIKNCIQDYLDNNTYKCRYKHYLEVVPSKDDSKNCYCCKDTPATIKIVGIGKKPIYVCRSGAKYIVECLEEVIDEFEDIVDYAPGFWLVEGSYVDQISEEELEDKLFISIGGNYCDEHNLSSYKCSIKIESVEELFEVLEKFRKRVTPRSVDSDLIKFTRSNGWCCVCREFNGYYRVGSKYMCRSCMNKLENELKKYIEENPKYLISEGVL